jgi:cytochrome c oxidase subunit 2
MEIPVWFQATKPGKYDLLCAELCGWGHYKMRGLLTVHSQSEFDQWLKDQLAEQEVSQ